MNLEEELEELSRLREVVATLRQGLRDILAEEGIPAYQLEPDELASWMVEKCLGLFEINAELKDQAGGYFKAGTPVIARIKSEAPGTLSDYYPLRTRVTEAPTLTRDGALVLRVEGYSDYVSVGMVKIDLARQREEQKELELCPTNLVSLSANISASSTTDS